MFRFFWCRLIVLGGRAGERRHAEIAGDRVERGPLVIELDAVRLAAAGGLHDFSDRPELRRLLHAHHALVVPFDDMAEIGEGDAGIFFEHAIGRDAEPGSAFGYLAEPCVRGLAPSPLQPARLDGQWHCFFECCGAGQGERLTQFAQCSCFVLNQSGFVNIKMRYPYYYRR